jgi:hypothetical protein
MKTKLIAIVALCLLLSPQNLYGWNGHGHRVIASIAFLQLSPERRLEIANRIKNHPRWESDFASKMPDVVKAGDEQIKVIAQNFFETECESATLISCQT